MDSKLINSYAYLREHHPELDLLHSEAPSYIKTLNGNETKKIVFVHKYVNKSQVKVEQKSTTPIKKEVLLSPGTPNIVDDSTIVGSPLKDDCNVEELCVSPVLLQSYHTWTDQEENYTGLLHEDALNLLTDLHESDEIKSDLGSIWVMVDGGDENDKTLLLELEASKSWLTRGIVKLKGICQAKDINVNRLIEENRNMVRSRINTEIHVDTSYTFYNNTTLSFHHSSENELKNSGFLQNNDCTLRQIFNLKDVTADTSDFLNQIFLLNELFEIIVQFKEDYGDDEGKEPEYRRNSGIDMEFISNRILKILSAFPEPREIVDIDRKSLLETALHKAKDRKLKESTDQLWEILRYCKSMKDLKSALNLIFQTSVKCNIVNMPSTNTKLGELIRDVSERRIALPALTGSQPLELLIEIGLEKAIRDYEYIFEESRICGASDLKINKKDSSKPVTDTMNVRKSLYNAANKVTEASDDKQRKTLLHVNANQPSLVNESIVGFQNSRFNEAEVQEKLSRLLQIHLILEHLLLVQVNLGTGNIHSSIAMQMLQEEPVKLKKIIKDGLNKLEVNVVDDKLKDLIENKLPSAKRISVTSQNKFKKLQTVNYFSLDPIFPTNVYEKLFKQEEAKSLMKGSTKKDIYWHFSYTKIGTKRS
uniref:Protein zwilch n=1 Tax=Culicoides sonorensis TaxID=179676 RepID=A0A336LTS3_CULSO